MPHQFRLFALPKSLGEILSSGASPAPEPSPLQPAQPSKLPEKLQKMGDARGSPASTGVTFAGQDKLPRLPIPALENTCNKYLAALKPLQDPREHAETSLAVHEFLHHDGPQLQTKLQEYAKDKISYIEQFCEYITGYRD